MKFETTRVKLQKGQVVTSLYHSPFDLNLFYIICFAKTGVNLRVILDDIDNMGIDRTNDLQEYAYKDKFFLSKTSRTNIRPLTLTLPKHLCANLSYPTLKELDLNVGINKLKGELGYTDTVDHWIKDTTQSFGAKTLVGPDRAFCSLIVDDNFVSVVRDVRFHIKKMLSKFTICTNSTLEFVDWLLDDCVPVGTTVSDYFSDILNKIICKYGLDDSVSVERMSDSVLQRKSYELYEIFEADNKLKDLYSKALQVGGKNSYNDIPFYSICKKTGKRMLDVSNYTKKADDFIFSPKVLMLNNFDNLVLPYHAAGSMNVMAREVMYGNEKIKTNQIFCDDKWVEWLGDFDLSMRLDEAEVSFYGEENFSFNNFTEVNIDSGNVFKSDGNIEDRFKAWVVLNTYQSLDFAKYPIIFLALLQDKIFYDKIPDLHKLTIK